MDGCALRTLMIGGLIDNRGGLNEKMTATHASTQTASTTNSHH